MPVFDAPTALTTASTTSRPKRERFSIDPPYSSVRWLDTSCCAQVSLSSLLARCTHQELIDEVAVRAVDLDAIEAGTFDRVLRSSRVPLHVLLDLGDGERARCLVVAGELDRGGSDVVEGGVFRFQLSRNSRASEGPELEVDEGALGVDCVCDLALGECDRLLGCVFTRTSFHLLICSSLQMPGTFV